MANSDARPVPRKNEPYRLGFCIRDLNYRLTNWSDPAAYISLDGGSFSTGNDQLYFSGIPVEIDSVGIGYVDITASGMNADLVMVRICNNSGLSFSSQYNAFEKIYPEEPGDYRCDVVMVSGLVVDLENIVDANVVQVSGIPISRRTIIPANVEQVSGEYVSINDFKADVSNISGDVNVISISGVPVSIDNNSIADSTELSAVGNLLIRNSRIVRLLP